MATKTCCGSNLKPLPSVSSITKRMKMTKQTKPDSLIRENGRLRPEPREERPHVHLKGQVDDEDGAARKDRPAKVLEVQVGNGDHRLQRRCEDERDKDERIVEAIHIVRQQIHHLPNGRLAQRLVAEAKCLSVDQIAAGNSKLHALARHLEEVRVIEEDVDDAQADDRPAHAVEEVQKATGLLLVLQHVSVVAVVLQVANHQAHDDRLGDAEDRFLRERI
ncbi:hypothetical protein TYRP_006913 [Tyrophagus putrescentiae]|nr:hypothetical protein TYRP_006913 [Tyrophagus putrescentiae]